MRKSYAYYFKNKFKSCQFMLIAIFSYVQNKQTFRKKLMFFNNV